MKKPMGGKNLLSNRFVQLIEEEHMSRSPRYS